MSTRSFKQGEVIFRQGDRGETMYCVVSGQVGIYGNYGAPGEKLLTTVTDGRYFGEMALVDELPRSAAAVALTDAETVEYTRETYNEYLMNNPQIAIGLMKNLSARLRSLTDDYMDACKAISEMLEEDQKPRKKGLMERLRHYAKVYADALDTAYATTDGEGRPLVQYHDNMFNDLLL